MSTPAHSRVSRLARGWVLGVLALVLIVASARAALVLFEPQLLGYARRTLETQLGGLLQGEVHIDRLERLSFGGLVARGVTVLDPEGRVVLRAAHLALDVDLYALGRGLLHFTRGELRGARIRAIPSEQTAITLFDALMPTPSDAPSDASTLSVWFENIHVDDALLYGDVPGFSGLCAEHLTARGHIRIDDTFVADVRHVEASFTEPFSAPITLAHGITKVVAEPFQLDVAARLSQRDDHVHLALKYSAPSNAADELDLTLMAEPVSSDLLRALNIPIGASLIAELRGPVHIRGPLDHLTFAASLQSEAGPLVVRGAAPTNEDMTLEVQSEGLDFSNLLAYFPPVQIQATVSAKVPSQGPIAIEAQAPWVDVMGVKVQRVKLQGAYDEGRFELASAEAHYAGGQFWASGWVDENLDAKLHVRSRVPELGREPNLGAVGLRTALHTDAVLEKQGETLSFDGDLGLERFSYAGLEFARLQLSGSARVEGDFARPRVQVQGRAQGLAFEGYEAEFLSFSVRGDRGRYASQFSFRDRAQRALSGRVAVEQLGERLHVKVSPFELAVGGREAWRADADLMLEPDGIDFRKVSLMNGPQRLEVSGRYSFTKAYRVDATLQSFDLGGLRELSGVDLADLDGTVDGRLALTGVPNHPRIDAEGSVRGGVFLGMTDLTLMLSLIFVEGRFDIESELLLADGSRLAIFAGGEPGEGESWLTQIARGNYEFGLDFEHVPFAVSEPWLAWIGVKPPPGNVSATIRGAGNLDAPLLDVSSRVEGLVVGDLPRLNFQFAASHDGAQLALRGVEIEDPHGVLARAEADLEASLEQLLDLEGLRQSLDSRPYRLRVEWPERRLDQLPADLRVQIPLLTSGALTLEQTPEGPLAQLTVRASWPRESPGLGACTLVRRPTLHLVATSSGLETRARVDVMLDRENVATGEARAHTPLAAWLTGAAAWSLPPTSLRLTANTASIEEVPVVCEYMAGPLRAEITANDLFADPPDIHFVFESPALQLVPHTSQLQRFGRLRAARSAGRPFAVSMRGGAEGDQVTFSAALDEGNGARLDAQATVPRAALRRSGERAGLPRARVSLNLRKFEIAPIMLALPVGSRASGVLDGNVALTYDVATDALGLAGKLDLSDGRLVIAPLGQELSDVRASLRLSDNWIRIENLEAKDFEGRMRTEGNVVFDTARRVRSDLYLRLTDFPVRREGAQVSALTGRLRFRAEVDGQRTRSELQVLDLRVNLPLEMVASTQDLALHPDIHVAGEEPEPPPEDPYVFELRLLARKPPFRVMRTGLNAEVAADVLVRYREPLLTLQGSAELEHGNFELYGKRFELQEGRIAFDGDDHLDPFVSLFAVYEIGSDEIGVRVDGRLSDPKVTFTHSNPNIKDTGEIVAALMGARAADPYQRNRDASGAAAGFLAGATAGLLTEEVRREFGGAIPVLSIEAQNQSMRSTRIRAGVQLDQLIEKRLGPLRHVVRGAYVEGFVAPGADPNAVGTTRPPQSRGGGLLELRFPADMVGTVEYRPVQNWRLDVAWEP